MKPQKLGSIPATHPILVDLPAKTLVPRHCVGLVKTFTLVCSSSGRTKRFQCLNRSSILLQITKTMAP